MTRALIALAAGGSGGHFFPAEALARELKSRGHDILILTDRRGAAYADRLDGMTLVTLPAAAIGAGILGKFKTALVILHATWLAWRQLKRARARIMVTFGGYPSFAPALAARLAGMPLVLHEQATRLSLANRKLLPLATKLATSFPSVKGSEQLLAGRIVETGNPVRAEITALRDSTYHAFMPDGPLHLLVVGGSQSAQVFGEVVPPAVMALPQPLRERLHLSLQYKGDEAAAITAQLAAAGIKADVAPFFRDMARRLDEAHLLICRAGATTMAELLVVGRPAIFVPIPKGGSWQEQLRNAETMQEAGVGWCIRQDQLNPDDLAAMLTALFIQPDTLAGAAAQAHRLGQPQAARQLADLTLATLG